MVEKSVFLEEDLVDDEADERGATYRHRRDAVRGGPGAFESGQ